MRGEKVSIRPVKAEDKEVLAKIYKEVFSGHPWHEDLICANVLQEKCATQYTFNECERYDLDSSGKKINSCEEGYRARVGGNGVQEIVLLDRENPLEKCVGCGEELKVIPYYPNYRNHIELIEESINEDKFVGQIATQESGRVVGFAWGYFVPPKRTIAVNFPLINPLLEEKGINPKTSFYDSEIGVLDELQGQGIGNILFYTKLLRAHEHHSPEFLLGRTINPIIHKQLERIFSGKKARELFNDPETRSPWFSWEFKDFDKDGVWKKITEYLKK